MNIEQLGKILKTMFDEAEHHEKSIMILLFGIQYAEDIELQGLAVKDICQAAELPDSYTNGLNKGIKLARYVKSR